MTEIVDDDKGERWHVNRGIPVVFLISSLVYALAQIGAFSWYAAQISSRVDQLEKVQIQVAPQGERLTRLEEKVGAIQTGIADLKTDLKGVATSVATISNQTKPR